MLLSSSTPAANSASSTPPSICHHSVPSTQAFAAPARVLVAAPGLGPRCHPQIH
uniref:Uncharacterized protein n=1 Tax=Arundo donax TaxID=35708 RepID=A0A0A9G2D9_ARUDO